MALTFRVMSARCPTTLTGTTSQPKVTATPSRVQPAIVQETIRVVPTIMEQVIPYIQDLVVVSITITATVIKHTFQRETYGKVMVALFGLTKEASASFSVYKTSTHGD